MFVFINLASAVFMAPHLLKSLLGIDTMFTRSGTYLVNTTFWAGTAALAFLCLDPLVKAVYALRCFYGTSITTGRDLRVALAGLRGRGVAALLAVCLFVMAPAAAMATDAARTARRGGGLRFQPGK